MSDIKFSDTALSSYLIANGLAFSSNGFKDTSTRFFLMKGTIPNQGELDAAAANFRSADRLWYLNSSSIASTYTTFSGGVITLGYHEAAAVATGTATWFYWDGDTNQPSNGNIARLVGSVSGLGGGGDLEISSTSIVSGNVYGAGPVTLTVPQTYTY